jgi:asparagine synthase (glutamine-hydrolysing)
MSEFAGIVHFDARPVDDKAEEQIERAVAALPNGRVHVAGVEGAFFAQRAAGVTEGSRGEQMPLSAGSASLLFAANARLDNRAELGAALAYAPQELARCVDGALVFHMHRRWGEAGIARCLGAFAFALWNGETRRLVLARDCLGNRALFFHRGEGFVAFASSLGGLLAMPRVPRAIDELTIANYLVVNLRDPRRTFYRGVERVPSRTIVTIDAKAVAYSHYWSPDFHAPPPYRREDDYIERARELLDTAVADATCDTPRVAISTSGGLDSSAVAATVARLGRSESITCYTVLPMTGTQVDVGPHYYLTERDKVEALARMHPALTLHLVTPDAKHPFDEDDTRFFARANMPVLAASMLGAVGQLRDAIVAGRHRTLLVGTYGNSGLSWEGRFLLPTLLRAGHLRDFWRELNASARQSGVGRTQILGTEVIKPAAPVWLRQVIHRLKRRDPNDVARYSALNPQYIADCDLPRQWAAQGFSPWFIPNELDAARYRVRLLFDHNQFGRDYRAMSHDLLGYETRDPHADRRLLEFALAIPERMFRRDGIPRSFARAVLADRLPPEIVSEQRRGANVPDWFRRVDGRREAIAADIERLQSSPLASRLIDLPRLRRLVDQWPADEKAAQARIPEYKLVLARGIHIGRFIRWVEGGNS